MQFGGNASDMQNSQYNTHDDNPIHTICEWQSGKWGRIQIGTIRPVRVDHTNFFQVAIKTLSFIQHTSAYDTSAYVTYADDGLSLTQTNTYSVPGNGGDKTDTCRGAALTRM